MSTYEVLSLIFDSYICLILSAEYFFGRSDVDIKREASRKRKAREKYRFESLTSGEMK